MMATMGVTTGPWWTAWVLDLPALALMIGVAALYLRGAAARRSRGMLQRRRTVAFLVGATLLLLAHTSPIAAWSALLFWPHMVQHLLLIVVAAPVLAWSAPMATARLGLAPATRRGIARLIRRWRRWRSRSPVPPLVVATGVHVAAVWAWHVPAAFDAAVANPAVHHLEHLAFVGTAVWFWSEVWSTARRRPRSQVLATLCLGVMIAQGGVLGALLTFAGRPLYDTSAVAVGIGPMADQQLGGTLMWVGPGFVYATIAVRRFVGWLHAVEQASRGRELGVGRASPSGSRPAVER